MALSGRGHSSLCWCSLEDDKKVKTCPRSVMGGNGTKNTSATGQIALYVMRLEAYDVNIT